MTTKFFRSSSAFRAWLVKPHATTPLLLVGFHSYTIRFTPRRSRSMWSAVNVKRANELAWGFFQAQPPSYRKTIGWWVVSAKKEETRLERLGQLIDDAAHGRRR